MNQKGLTLIEVVVAMLILTVGLLGLAAGTGWVLRNVEAARVDTSRATAIQSAIERVRSVPFDDLATPGSATLPDGFTVSWTRLGGTNRHANMQIIVVGPGRTGAAAGGMPGLTMNAADTITYRVLR